MTAAIRVLIADDHTVVRKGIRTLLLTEPGLEYNFNMLKKWFGATVHVRELNEGDYPYQQLMNLFVGMDYKGWILLEARTEPADRVAALKEQKKIFDEQIAAAQVAVG